MCHNPDSKFLNWQRMYNILPFSGREIDGCKVPSKYSRKFLQVHLHSLQIPTIVDTKSEP
jgi:hypothetical protein